MTAPGQPRRDRSSSTEALRLPGAFEGETVSRRRFMTGTAHTAGAIAAAAFALPALGFAIGPVFDRAADTWQDIGPLSHFTESDYVPVVITMAPGIGEAGKSIAYVRKHNLPVDGPIKDRYDRVIAISSRCVHVGCPVRWVATSESFICPCHARRIRLPRSADRRFPTAAARSLLHAHSPRRGVPGPALQPQQRASTFLTPRPRRAARRDRTVPLSGALLDRVRAARRQTIEA
jgi:Rieske Fe-S protein